VKFLTFGFSGMPASTSDITNQLLARRREFKSFIASRLGSEADAEDLLQSGLVKALRQTQELKDGEKAVPWFYQLLRNAIVDHVRSRGAAAKREAAWVADAVALGEDHETERAICACFEKLLPLLKPSYAELLRRIELQGEPVAKAAEALGVTPNNASVTLHRARRELRAKLEALCGDCSCLDDCTCEPNA
jgi:RNA polymerase sigma-70 factor (ECF subfamily)